MRLIGLKVLDNININVSLQLSVDRGRRNRGNGQAGAEHCPAIGRAQPFSETKG